MNPRRRHGRPAPAGCLTRGFELAVLALAAGVFVAATLAVALAAAPPPHRKPPRLPSWTSAQRDSIYSHHLAIARLAQGVTLGHELHGKELGRVHLGPRWGQAFLDALDLDHRPPSRAPWRNVCGDSTGAPDVIVLRYSLRHHAEAVLRYRLGDACLEVGDPAVAIEERDRHTRVLRLIALALPEDNRVQWVQLCDAQASPAPPGHVNTQRPSAAASSTSAKPR